MNHFKRAVASVTRRPGKSITLLLLLFVLGNIIAGAISIRQAVNNTEANLRANLPAIAMLDQDQNVLNSYWANGESVPEEAWRPIPAEDITAIGNLPYVQGFDFSLVLESWNATIISPTLLRAEVRIDQDDLGDMSLEDFNDWESLVAQGIEFERFGLRGVHRPEMMEMNAGIINLASGRLFTDSEVNNGELVAIISQDFAETNNLQPGSTFTLEHVIMDEVAFQEEFPMGWSDTDRFNEEFFASREELVFTVAGIFTPELDLDFSQNNIWNSISQLRDFGNRIYVPNGVIERIQLANWEAQVNAWLEAGMTEEDLGLTGSFEEVDINDMMRPTAIFSLEDGRDLPAFRAAADDILNNEFWTIVDMSNAFGTFSSSMDSMLMIANLVMWVAIGATVVIITLLITLFLRDRRQEIGIYLALGEKRSRVVSQILMEVLSVSVVALLLSVATGTILSGNVSRQMLQNDLLAQQAEDPWSVNTVNVPWQLQAFAPAPMTIDEMVAAYDTSMEPTTILIFLGVGMGTVLVSTVVPIAYITRLNPKKIML